METHRHVANLPPIHGFLKEMDLIVLSWLDNGCSDVYKMEA